MRDQKPEHTGSLARRMMLIAAGWITILLLVGGVALDRTITNLLQNNLDERLNYILTAMVGSAEIDSYGDVWFNRVLGDQRFLVPNSGLYWQINGSDQEPFPSNSLWDRTLELRGDHSKVEPVYYNSEQFQGEELRIVERSVRIPGSDSDWTFAVAADRAELEAEIADIRSILFWSFVILGLGLILLAWLQVYYGLSPLRRVRRAIQRMRGGDEHRLTEPLPYEVQPMVAELNALLAHSEKQAEEARMHAGNLAHALKTPLTVLVNAATARDPKLSNLVHRETRVMQRQVEHHLARARAVGRRATGLSRAEVWPSAESVLRAVTRLYENTRFDLDGNKAARVAIERQDLDEILGNLIENAAKYGGGSVFVTVDANRDDPDFCDIWVEDDGLGIPEADRIRIFDRGARLDTGKPGTGLGLAIVRDVAEIYGGKAELRESEDLGGLLVILRLPRSKATRDR
ncbi:sensor histidine kinase [Pseudoblastomonas halimionae]|uniref:histidine kinase n=1 Tax=Alteriqipengyuania halimionae TaxID=1926630 RepID=A0A6I4U1H2_9SPHN|nr:HAMP domain-containing sensor histidine kinase [Alteriqipengyuania halimionae]MXP09134.1 histidine kinase [Alteriqipengyuania halimionae]